MKVLPAEYLTPYVVGTFAIVETSGDSMACSRGSYIGKNRQPLTDAFHSVSAKSHGRNSNT